MRFIKSLLFLLLAIPCIYADLYIVPEGEISLDELKKEVLFVSLGSTCLPAGLLRAYGLRKAAFPLDWALSLDNEGLIQAIDEDFLHFLNDDYLIPDNFIKQRADGATLCHLRYHFEFVHEGDFWGLQYEKNMEGFRERYQRRVERFRKLSDYPGKVIFLRSCYGSGVIDANRAFNCSEIVDISDEDAIRLYTALKNRFPKLSMNLVIMNEGFLLSHEIVIDKEINDELLKVRAKFPTQVEINQGLIQGYKEFFFSLLH